MSDGTAGKNNRDFLKLNADSQLAELFSRRLIFVMGKGGVGKTTISTALAIAAERMGKRVLLAEIGDSDAIGQIFINDTLPEAPLKIADRIWGARVNPKTELALYVRHHINSKFFANRITRSRLFDYLVAAAPGLREIMSLGRIWRWTQEAGSAEPFAYDLIIVDAPATGHALSLLRLPRVLIEMIRFGPIVKEVRELESVLRDPARTWLTLVTLAEELPTNEALQLYQAADADLGMPFKMIFINAVYPRVFTKPELERINDLKSFCRGNDTDTSCLKLLEAADHLIRMRRRQQPYIDRIKSKTRGGGVEVPVYYTNHLSIGDIGDIASRMIRQMREQSEP